jgi:hypothetical protein
MDEQLNGRMGVQREPEELIEYSKREEIPSKSVFSAFNDLLEFLEQNDRRVEFAAFCEEFLGSLEDNLMKGENYKGHLKKILKAAEDCDHKSNTFLSDIKYGGICICKANFELLVDW